MGRDQGRAPPVWRPVRPWPPARAGGRAGSDAGAARAGGGCGLLPAHAARRQGRELRSRPYLRRYAPATAADEAEAARARDAAGRLRDEGGAGRRGDGSRVVPASGGCRRWWQGARGGGGGGGRRCGEFSRWRRGAAAAARASAEGAPCAITWTSSSTGCWPGPIAGELIRCCGAPRLGDGGGLMYRTVVRQDGITSWYSAGGRQLAPPASSPCSFFGGDMQPTTCGADFARVRRRRRRRPSQIADDGRYTRESP